MCMKKVTITIDKNALFADFLSPEDSKRILKNLPFLKNLPQYPKEKRQTILKVNMSQKKKNNILNIDSKIKMSY